MEYAAGGLKGHDRVQGRALSLVTTMVTDTAGGTARRVTGTDWVGSIRFDGVEQWGNCYTPWDLSSWGSSW